MVGRTGTIGEEQPHARGERRRAILDAAMRLFAQRGFGAVSLQEIADAAHTHKTTVLYHFATKETLQDAVLDEAFGRLSEVMNEFLAGEGRRERVAYMLDQIHAFFAAQPELARILQRELLEPSGDEAHIQRFVEAIYVPAVESLERAIALGQVRPIDPALFIHDMHVQLIGYFCHAPLIERLRPGDPFSIERLIARRDHLIDQIFRQLWPDGRPPDEA
jgi:AcrR family transcriptional regulator